VNFAPGNETQVYLASKLIIWFSARMKPIAEPDIPICLTMTGKKGRIGEPPEK
jgi:hypothetical protein